MHRLYRSTLAGHLAHLKRRRRGQALVEFAIVAPVMVTTLLFSIYFYELIQIKLKTQEMARFAAWEFTGYPLHNYHDGTTNQFNRARTEITEDVQRRYANLKSVDRQTQNKVLAVEWSPPSIRAEDQVEPRLPGGSLVNMAFTFATLLVDALSMRAFTHNNYVLALMVGAYQIQGLQIYGARRNLFNPPRGWRLNTKGYPKVTVRLQYRNLMIPTRFMEGSTGWYSTQHFKITRRAFTETTAVVADSWRLHNGEDVDGPRDRSSPTDKAFFRQVDRMAFVTPEIKKGVELVFGIAAYGMAAMQLLSMQPPLTMTPTETTLVSKAYGRDGSNSSKGTVSINEDGPTGSSSVSYDTLPFKPGSEYVKSFEKRGNNFMGCNQPEQLGCFDSTSQNNPFGDFVEPPPETP